MKSRPQQKALKQRAIPRQRKAPKVVQVELPFAVCQCHDGYFKAPLSMLAIKDGYCKHVLDILAGLQPTTEAKPIQVYNPVTVAQGRICPIKKVKGRYEFSLHVQWREDKKYENKNYDVQDLPISATDLALLPMDGYVELSYGGFRHYRPLEKKGNSWFLGSLQILEEVSKNGNN